LAQHITRFGREIGKHTWDTKALLLQLDDDGENDDDKTAEVNKLDDEEDHLSA